MPAPDTESAELLLTDKEPVEVETVPLLASVGVESDMLPVLDKVPLTLMAWEVEMSPCEPVPVKFKLPPIVTAFELLAMIVLLPKPAAVTVSPLGILMVKELLLIGPAAVLDTLSHCTVTVPAPAKLPSKKP